MYLCSNEHEEICYTSRQCPCCEITKNKNDEVEKLVDKVADLLYEINELKGA